MNNQYKYFGQHLTARMSRELIQELFAGQTVQRQEIIRAVDEAHLERGGLPKRSIAHPVGSALSVMKADGLAESPEYSVWSILSETIDMNKMNKLYFGDNLEILREMDDERVDLICTDPPFNSGRDYNAFIDDSLAQKKAFTDTWTWDTAAQDARADIDNAHIPMIPTKHLRNVFVDMI